MIGFNLSQLRMTKQWQSMLIGLKLNRLRAIFQKWMTNSFPQKHQARGRWNWTRCNLARATMTKMNFYEMRIKTIFPWSPLFISRLKWILICMTKFIWRHKDTNTYDAICMEAKLMIIFGQELWLPLAERLIPMVLMQLTGNKEKEPGNNPFLKFMTSLQV